MKSTGIGLALLLILIGTGAVARGQAPANPFLPPVPPPAPPLEFEDSLFSSISTAWAHGLSFSGEYLLAQPRRDNLALGVVSPIGSGAYDGRLSSIRYGSASGFRVGAVYAPPGSAFDVSGSFSYFHSHSQRTVIAPADSYLHPAVGIVDRRSGSADADAGINYAVTDIDFGHTFAAGDNLSVRVFGGARFAQLNQSFKVIYAGARLADATDFVSSPVRFQGGGLSAGGEGTLRLPYGFGIYGRARVAVLGGEFESRMTEALAGQPVLDLRDYHRTVIPVAELGVGVSYTRRHFSAGVGYDISNWFNVVEGLAPASRSQTTRVRGDLSFEMLSVRLGYAF